MFRKTLVAALTGASVLLFGLPVAADEILYDSDLLTAGAQTSAINLTASPGQVQSVPVDLFISCKTKNHIGGNVTVTLAAPGGNGSTVPTGGTLSAGPVTIVRPASWPSDDTNCPNPNPSTQPARATLFVGAPSTVGVYNYKTRWTTNDGDAMSGVQDAEISINLTVRQPAPTDTTPPVINKTVSGAQGSNGWYTSAVTVTWSVTDAQSSVTIDAGCGTQNFVNETAAESSSCVAHSAGGSASDSATFKIDQTGPSAVLSPNGTLGQNGWYTSNVVLKASGEDTVSGGVTCAPDQTQSTETTGTTFTASCTNAAGLTSQAAPVTVKVDKTGPSASLAVISGDSGQNGWYTSDVTVRAAGTDSISGGVTCSGDLVVTTDTPGTPVNGSCTNAAGLATAAGPLIVKLDKSDPTAQLAIVSGSLGSNGWFTSDVTLHASGSDNVSEPVACPADQHQTTDTDGSVFTATCTNDAGRAYDAVPVTIRRDASPPTAALEVTAGTPGANGWYTSPVTVRTVGADPTSGVTCTSDQVFDQETSSSTVTGFCLNGAGLRTDADSITLKIDLTGPTASIIVIAGTLGADGWYTSNVTLRTTGADSVGGSVSCDADQFQTTETTGKAFTGSCINAAGLSTVSDPVTVKLDKTAPSASLSASGTLGLNGWYTSDVTVGTSGTDTVSDVVTCTGDQQQTNETPGASFSGSCTNGAGLTGAASPLTIKVDKTGPVATLSTLGAIANAAGWFTNDVTIRTDGSDDLSGPVTCTADRDLTTDTAGTTFEGSCANRAGLNTDAAPLTVKLDMSNPSATLSASGERGSGEWFTGDVTVSTTGADNVSEPVVCTDDQYQLTDTQGQRFDGSCTNEAGLAQDADPITVKRDSSKPTAELVVSGTGGANGWYTSNVTVTVVGEDETSGVTCTGGATLTAETAGTEVTGFCVNGAGLREDAQSVTIRIDKTAPTASLAVTAGTPGDNGWYTSDVTVTTDGSDDMSGGVVCTGPQDQTAESKGKQHLGSCTNAAGLTGHAAPLTVKLDKTAPQTKLVVSDGTEGNNGWYTSSVTIRTSGSDDISGIASCTADQHQIAETTGETFTGECRNEAGLVRGDELTVKVDKTGPAASIALAGTSGENGWYTGNVTATTSGSDAVSGPVACTAEQQQTTETKGRQFTGSCTNSAGLSTDADPVTVKLDKSAPSAALTVDGAPGSNGWYTDDVTVTTSGEDDISGPPACTAAQILVTDTAGTEVNGSCRNEAGLQAQAAPRTVKLDKSNPTAHLSVSQGSLGANGWYRDAVTISTNGSDNVSEPLECTADQFQTTDTDAAGHDFFGSCTNNAGRTQVAEKLNVKRDASAPTARLVVVAGTPGDNGWYTSAVTVRTVGEDAQSGVTCTVDQTITAETTGQLVNGSCANGAGTVTNADPITVRLDTTGPSAVLAVVGGTPGSNGWYTSDVTVGTSGSDAVSGGVVCTVNQSQITETTGALFNGSCRNAAGLETSAAPLTVKLDKSAPSAQLAADKGTTGSNGWYVTPVEVVTTGSDDISGPVTCTERQVFSSDTQEFAVNGMCTNGAGLTRSAQVLSIKIDQIAPVVTVVNLDPSYEVGEVPQPGCTTTDATSGVAAQAGASVPVLSGVGSYTVVCSGARDNAGNGSSASATLRSIYRWDGFLQPINDTAHEIGESTSIFKAGSTVPVKFQLKRADGSIITPANAPQWLNPVKGSATSAAVDESLYSAPATSGSVYRYDANAHQWIYNWSTKGHAAGFYYRIGVKLDDGQTYFVNIGLR